MLFDLEFKFLLRLKKKKMLRCETGFVAFSLCKLYEIKLHFP